MNPILTLNHSPAPQADSVAATALANGGPLAEMPNEVLVMMSRELDLQDLFSLSTTSSFWRNFVQDDVLWRVIAEQIRCPLMGNLPYRDQVERFVKDIVQKVKIWKTPDLETIKSCDLSISQIQHLQNFLIARDIVEVWESLGLELDPYAELVDIHGFDVQICNSTQIIEQAKNFNNWFVAHQNDLDQLTELSLINRYLTHLPEQICRLPALRRLDLTGNLLTAFPIETAALPQLAELNLSKNPIKLDSTVNPSILLITDDFLEQVGCTKEELEALKDLEGIENIPDPIQQIAAQQYLTLEQLITLHTWRVEHHCLPVPKKAQKLGSSLYLPFGLVGLLAIAYAIYFKL